MILYTHTHTHTHTSEFLKEKRIQWVDYLKAMACIAVIMIHVISGWLNNEHRKISQLRWFTDEVFLQTIIRFAVPTFIMISGILLLNPEHKLGIDKIKKYIKKMACILFTFSFIFCLLEEISICGFSNILVSIGKSIIEVFTQKGWAHFWYIYMLIGLYIFTPILRKFVETADDSTAKFTLILLFITSIVIPTINDIFNIEITTFYLEGFKYVFMYLIGYYVVYSKIFNEKHIFIGGIIGIIGYFLCAYFLKINLNESMFTVLEALFLIKIFSSEKIKIKNNYLMNCIAKYSLEIYLIHQFWLNLLYKIFEIFPDVLPILLGEIVICLYALILSIISSIILHKLPIIKNF